jgi:hypothetical protein
MIKSALRPETIANPNKASLGSFGNFIAGRNTQDNNPIHSSNNIVNFNRVQAISPLTPDVNSTIQNISTNILNNVDRSIRNISEFNRSDITSLKNDIYSKIERLSSDYEVLKQQVDLTSLKSDDAINIAKEQSIEQFKIDTQRLLNDIQEKSNESDIELQKRIESIQNDINSIANTQTTTTPQVESKTSATWIQSIATNIKSEVDSILQNTLRNFSQDYNQRVKTFDDTRPNNVLTKFTSLYQNAIGFITYFGNDKNIKVVQDNLKFLKKMFLESFEVSKVLRQTIVKIVKQLSNLPSASPNSGGLDLNISVPGGKLKQSAGPAVRNVGRGARLGSMLGVGALGLGGAAAAMSGMQSAKQFQEEKLAEGVSPVSGGEYIPENIVENFSSIVKRFSSAVDNLINGIKKSSGVRDGEGDAKGGGGPPTASPGTSGGGGPSGITIKDDSQGLSELGITQEEWNAYKQGIADIEVAGQPNGGYGIMGGAGGRFAGRYQMGDEAFIEASKVLGIPKPSRQEFLSNPELQEKMYLGYTISNFRYMQSMSPEFRNMTREQQLATLPMAQLGIGNLSNQLRTGTIARDQRGTPTTKFSASVNRRISEAGLNPLGKNINSPTSPRQSQAQTTPSAPPQPRVEPASAKAQNMDRISKSVSTPAQRAPEMISLPPTTIDATQTAPEPQGGGASTPPQPSGGSIEVPFLPTTNPDNFLTMYSRIVYNIVDG